MRSAAEGADPIASKEFKLSETNRSWAAVEFDAPAEQEELAGWVMVHVAGAVGCEIRATNATNVCVHASFDRDTLQTEDMAKIGSALEEYGLAGSLASLRMQAVQEEDWLAKWKQGFRPFPVGEKLIVCPPWDVPTEAGERRALIIEPAMAFGTGLHPTTQFCLRMLETLPLGEHLLDVGTGSGILAIAAVMLDSRRTVVGVDTDPIAIDNARKNAELNGVSAGLRLITGSTEKIAEVFDSLLSNLTCEDIVALLPEYRRLIKPGGRVVCAGILAEKEKLLDAACAANGFRVESMEDAPPWRGVVLRCTADLVSSAGSSALTPEPGRD